MMTFIHMPLSNEEQKRIARMEREITRLTVLLQRKTGSGSADMKGNLTNPSNVGSAAIANNTITNAMMTNDAIKQAEWDYETATVTVSAGNPTGTDSVTASSIIVGWYPTGNMDQFVDNISISGTTLTVTLAAQATADNTFTVVLLKV